MAGDIPITEKCKNYAECEEFAKRRTMSIEEKINDGVARILNTVECLSATMDDFETYFFSVMHSEGKLKQKIHPSTSASLIQNLEIVQAYIERIERRLEDIYGEFVD